MDHLPLTTAPPQFSIPEGLVVLYYDAGTGSIKAMGHGNVGVSIESYVVSSQIADASIGGGGDADAGRVVLYDSHGVLQAALYAAFTPDSGGRLATLDATCLAFTYGFQCYLRPSAFTAVRTIYIPNADGTLAALPTYADDAAAKTDGLVRGDLYYTGSKFTSVTT